MGNITRKNGAAHVQPDRARAPRESRGGRAAEIAGLIVTIASALAVWPGLYFYALAVAPGA